MDRTLEPVLMTGDEQCKQFDRARNQTRLNLFVDQLQSTFKLEGNVADLGCGPGWVDIELCKRYDIVIDAYDGSSTMINHAKHNVRDAELCSRIFLHCQEFDSINETYSTVISTDALHHVADPATFWNLIKCMNPNRVFVMDLVRPDSVEQLERIVRVCSTTQDPLYVEDFRRSLMAAFTEDEIRQQLKQSNLNLDVTVIGKIFKTAFVHGVLTD